METPKPVINPTPRTVLVPQMGGNVQLASLMQQMVPSYYANGFEVAVSGADVCITLAQNNRQIGTVNLSFISAKALGSSLSALIKELEEKSQTKIPSVEEVAKAMQIK
jgi:hypothetical protein